MVDDEKLAAEEYLNKCEAGLNTLERLRKEGRAGSGEYGNLISQIHRLTRERAKVLGITLKPAKEFLDEYAAKP